MLEFQSVSDPELRRIAALSAEANLEFTLLIPPTVTALAATSELAPTAKRGKYVAVLIFTILPFCPSVLWGQLIAAHAGWRWCGLLCGLWASVGFFLTLIFYFPPPRVNSAGLSKKEVLAQIDFVGGFLSISGMILFMAGMQWGGYQYKWSSAHVLAPLLLGVALLVAFAVWEVKGAKHPIFPSRLKQAPRILALTLVITFISGANFFSIIMFWPTQAFSQSSSITCLSLSNANFQQTCMGMIQSGWVFVESQSDSPFSEEPSLFFGACLSSEEETEN